MRLSASSWKLGEFGCSRIVWRPRVRWDSRVWSPEVHTSARTSTKNRALLLGGKWTASERQRTIRTVKCTPSRSPGYCWWQRRYWLIILAPVPVWHTPGTPTGPIPGECSVIPSRYCIRLPGTGLAGYNSLVFVLLPFLASSLSLLRFLALHLSPRPLFSKESLHHLIRPLHRQTRTAGHLLPPCIERFSYYAAILCRLLMCSQYS